MPGVGGHPTGHPTALHRRSSARTAVVWDALQRVLDGRQTAARVLDIGGGTGEVAVRVAELGHTVVVVDPSPDALAILDRRAEERGVADRVVGVQGEVAGEGLLLSDLSEKGSSEEVTPADVVLCHGVLEVVEDPVAAVGVLAAWVRPLGTLSLVVAQRHAAVVARAMAGHFHQARALLDAAPSTGHDASAGHAGRRFTAEEVTTLLVDAGFEDVTLHAVRVFADLVPSSLVDLEPGAAEALVALEHAVAERPEYLALAAQVHALATRPGR